MAERVVMDVRDDIRLGREPFHTIMDAAKRLKPWEELVIVNWFEPRPLYRALEGFGLRRRAEMDEDGVWRVTFFRPQRS